MSDGQQEGTLPKKMLQLWKVWPYSQGLPPTIKDAKDPDQCCNGGRPRVKKGVKPVRAACNANVESVSAGVAQAKVDSVTLLQCKLVCSHCE